MHVVSDDERREVAARLRSLEVSARVKRMEHPDKTAAWYELLCDAVGGKKDPWFGIKAFANRLADLIDPGESGQNRDRNQDTVSKESSAVQKAPECDREALLALADGIVDAVRDSSGIGIAGEFAEAMRELAKSICEACGEVDA